MNHIRAIVRSDTAYVTLAIVLLVVGVNAVAEYEGGWSGAIGGACLGLFASMAIRK